MDEFFVPQEEVADDGGRGFAGIGYEEIFKSASPILELRKALAAGTSTDHGAMSDGNALRIESLESTLKSLTFNERSTTLANDLLASKKKAESTVEEYSTIDDVTEAFTYAEGGLPGQEDDQYSRKFELIKFVGAVGSVTNPMLAVRSLVPAIAQETKMKALAIKRKLNILGYFGNKTLVPTEFNGMIQAVIDAGLTDNVIDLRGKRPTVEIFNQGVNVIESVAGYTENLRCYISPTAKMNYRNELLANKRYMTNGGDGSQTTRVQGVDAGKLMYDGGEMPFRKDMFLNPRKFARRNRANNAFVATGSTPPNTPTITSVTPTPDATSLLAPGTYDFSVVAINKYGHRSAPATVNGTDIVIPAGNKAVFVVADNGSTSGQEATAFEVYRRDSASTSDTDWRYLFTSAIAGGSDSGQNMPDTGYMVMVEWDRDQVLAYHQLLDMAKFPLGAVADAIRWLQRLYGALLVYNPKRIVVFKNVGTEAWA